MDMMFPIHVINNKKRCPHLALHMECNVGGNATAECFHPSFHSECHFRKRAERKYERLDAKKPETPTQGNIHDKSNGLL